MKTYNKNFEVEKEAARQEANSPFTCLYQIFLV